MSKGHQLIELTEPWGYKRRPTCSLSLLHTAVHLTWFSFVSSLALIILVSCQLSCVISPLVAFHSVNSRSTYVLDLSTLWEIISTGLHTFRTSRPRWMKSWSICDSEKAVKRISAGATLHLFWRCQFQENSVCIQTLRIHSPWRKYMQNKHFHLNLIVAICHSISKRQFYSIHPEKNEIKT